MIIFTAALFYFSSLDKSITAAGHGAGSSRRRPCWYPPSLGAPSHTLHHSPVTQRPGWDRTSNPWTREAALLPVSHRSLVGSMWRNVYLTVDPWVPNKEVKVNCVCDLMRRDLNPCLHHRLIFQQCLRLSTRPSWISWFVLVFERLCWMKSI